jgi:hypothetical protein
LAIVIRAGVTGGTPEAAAFERAQWTVPFDDLPHIGHLIVSEAFITPIIEAEGADAPSCILLIIVRVYFRCIVSLIVKTLSEATHPPG